MLSLAIYKRTHVVLTTHTISYHICLHTLLQLQGQQYNSNQVESRVDSNTNKQQQQKYGTIGIDGYFKFLRSGDEKNLPSHLSSSFWEDEDNTNEENNQGISRSEVNIRGNIIRKQHHMNGTRDPKQKGGI